MASSSQYPLIRFGEFPPDTLSILRRNAADTQTHRHSSTPPPLFPQLRFSLTKHPPRTPPRKVSQPLPLHPILSAEDVNRSYLLVPANWCLTIKAGTHGMYLSKDRLLQKMYPRWNLYRSFRSNDTDNKELVGSDVHFVFGSPVDYFLTFPLKPLECNEAPPPLEGMKLGENQPVAHVRAIGPVKSSRYTLNRHPGTGLQSQGGRLFPWVANSTGTKMLSFKALIDLRLMWVTGFVECPKCGNVWGIGYRLERYVEAALYVFMKKAEMMGEGNQVFRCSPFNCKCDGMNNPVRPVISDDFSKINWMCLYLGYGLGYCKEDQLRYYCRERNLEQVVDLNLLLLGICIDLMGQVDAGSSPLPSSS